MTYVVSIFAADTSRQKVYAALREYASSCPIHPNCWAITTECTSIQIRDKIQPLLTNGESVFVIRSGTEAAWLSIYGEDNNKWLKEHL